MIILPKLLEGKFWNKGPMVVTGCTKCSPGCANCWSEKAHAMHLSNPAVAHVYSPSLMDDGKFNGKVQFNLHLLEKAVKTKAPQVIAIWNDLYHKGVTDGEIIKAFQMMWETAHHLNRKHIFLVITKRPERAARYHQTHRYSMPPDTDNIWHIATMENQEMVEKRMPHLLNVPGKRGIIIEPMLEKINIGTHCDSESGCFENMICSEQCIAYRNGIHQVILGGETGPGARPMHPDWVRSIRDQCEAAGVPFYFKAWGEWASYGLRPSEWPHGSLRHTFEDGQDMIKVGRKKAGRTLDGREHNALAWVTP